MKTEKIVNKTSGKCLNIVANTVESLRINNSTENTVRVYDNGCIGVEGALGHADWAALEAGAAAKLAQGIEYPETHEEARNLQIDATKHFFDEKDFVPKMQHLLDRLAQENPKFLFSNKIIIDSTDASYESSDNVKYLYKGNEFDIVLVIKYKGSANIQDEFYGAGSDYFDEDEICHDIKLKCDAFLNALPQVEEDEITIIGDVEPLSYAIQHIVADMYFNNASLFSGKLGSKLFSDKLSVTVNRSPDKQLNIPFFDAEGVVNPDYVNYVIQNGVLKNLLTNKKSAAQYNTALLGSAGANYTGVPVAGMGGFDVATTASSLDELVKGKAIYLSATSGGDMTPAGDISMPAQVAYLYQDGKLVGKLPEFAVSANIFDMLNDGFVGYCEKGFYKFGKQSYFVYKAKLVNKAQ